MEAFRARAGNMNAICSVKSTYIITAHNPPCVLSAAVFHSILTLVMGV
jgi:hypothetical protein